LLLNETTSSLITEEGQNAMMSNRRTEYLTRTGILMALSDHEIARVCTAETADRLLEGDEYLDLEELHRGVRHALGMTTPTSRVLPRKAIHQNTWIKILTRMAAPPSAWAEI
jgi:hypothetical protein